MAVALTEKCPEPALRRMCRLTTLSPQAQSALAKAIGRKRNLSAHRDVIAEGAPIPAKLLIVAGWAARVRHLTDGRRQILSILLPGDLIGHCWQAEPLAISTITTVSNFSYCTLPATGDHDDLDEAYGISHALDEAILLSQIARLGRLNAEERLIDLFSN
jgi:CRP-like cAMP-binding protein